MNEKLELKEIKIENTRGYGVALSDLEGSWDTAFKSKIRKISMKIIMKQVSFFQKIQLLFYFYKEKQKAKNIDLSDIKLKGLTNTSFINQQLEYISLFSALVKVLNKDKALKIMYSVMDATAREAFSLSSPTIEEVKQFGDSMEFFRKYFFAFCEASTKAGCHDMIISENTINCIQIDIKWCVWYELAKKMDVPEACIPNCYADDLYYPDYFKSFGIKYSRKGTLANGNKYCDCRFER
jgi:hypothetical protein